jgi:hypothetical protein
MSTTFISRLTLISLYNLLFIWGSKGLHFYTKESMLYDMFVHIYHICGRRIQGMEARLDHITTYRAEIQMAWV